MAVLLANLAPTKVVGVARSGMSAGTRCAELPGAGEALQVIEREEDC